MPTMRSLPGALFPALLAALLLPHAVAAGSPDVPAGRLRGIVRSTDQLPLQAATIIAARTEGDAALGLTATDERGLLALDGLPPGVYRVQAQAEGFESGVIDGLEIRGPYRAVADFTLERGYAKELPISLEGEPGDRHVQLRVEDPQGHPLPGVHIRFDPLAHRANPAETVTDEEGRSEVGTLADGAWRLRVFRAGWAPLAVGDLTWKRGGLQVLVRMMPLPEGAPVPLDQLLPRPRFLEHESATTTTTTTTSSSRFFSRSSRRLPRSAPRSSPAGGGCRSAVCP